MLQWATMSQVKKSSRIIALDLLRGYFLIAILFDHLQYFPNGFDWMSGRGQLFVSAAEGFFFISGIVLGIVRGRKLLEKPFSVAAKLLLKRGLQLYLTAIALFFIFTFIGWLFINNPGVKPGIRPMSEGFWSILVNALDFNYIYGWADYLRLYAIYMFVSPLVMWLLRKGKWYIALAASLICWYLYDYSPLETPELSQVFSWQLIFFGGMTIGFYLESIRNWWGNLSLTIRKYVTGTVVTVALITMIANFIFVVWGPQIIGQNSVQAINDTLMPYLNKERLPLYRIALFLVWFGAGFWIMTKLERYIIKYLGWLLIPFGGNSLYVYTIEAFVIFFIHLVVPPSPSNLLINLALSLGSLGVVWLAVHYKFLMGIIPR